MSATQVLVAAAATAADHQVRPMLPLQAVAPFDSYAKDISSSSSEDDQDYEKQQTLVNKCLDNIGQTQKSQLKDHNSNVSAPPSDANTKQQQQQQQQQRTCTDQNRQQQLNHRITTIDNNLVMATAETPVPKPDYADKVHDDEGDDGDFCDAENEEVEIEEQADAIKCSAVHSLERDIPDCDYSHVVRELRDRILKDCQLNVGLYAQKDVDKCKTDQWFVERFLLRQKLDLDKAFDMLKRTMRFRNESLAHSIRREDFPAEFYQVGGLFCYEEDRKGNKMLYIRLKIHRKIPEIQLVLQAFLFYNIDYLDELANGKGIAIVLDCTGAGLANADMDMLMFLISTLVNYFPKGMSYLLVHELPWILKPFWHIAKAWLAEEHRELIKFSNSRTIYEYVNRENLPDFMGGTCERSYTSPPKDCTTLEQACKLWGIEEAVAKRILMKFAQYLPAEALTRCEQTSEDKNNNNHNHNDDYAAAAAAADSTDQKENKQF